MNALQELQLTISIDSYLVPFEDIKLIDEIGKGSSGITYLAEWNDEKVAVKRFKYVDVKVNDIISELKNLR